MEELRTDYAISREARDHEIYNEFQRLSTMPGAMRTKVSRIISEKYNLQSPSTLYSLRKRVEKRLSKSQISA